jgi:hypothetical protein
MQSQLVSDLVSVSIEIEGITPLSFGKHHNAPYLNNENVLAYEMRTYREKLHVNSDGQIFVPGMMMKKSVDAACKRSGTKIKGRGTSTYTKRFEAGVIPNGNFPITRNGIPILKEDVPGEELFVPSDGKRGGGNRVTKWFPIVEQWECSGEFIVWDNLIDPDIFKKTLKEAGFFIGLGRWRPMNAGLYGKFVVTDVTWNDPSGN